MDRRSQLLDAAPLLLIDSPDGRRIAVRLTGRTTRIGRDPDADICLPDPTRTLSRTHLLLERRGRRVLVSDRSTGGSRLAGQPLGRDPEAMSPGEPVSAGPFTLRLAAAASSDPCPSTRPPGAPVPAMEPSGLAGFHGLVGRDPSMVELFAQIERLARFDLPVLILGETGSGKERVADALHRASPRASAPFVAQNCGALDNGTVGSELFGHVKGAFTGAARDRAGLFERGHRGTVFLDEIAELSADHQARLLRVLETRRVRPIGGDRELPTDFRLLAATHRDLSLLVADGRFREDLRYRLEVALVRVPSLRDRRSDIDRLFRHFLAEAGPVPPITATAWTALRAHSWPGNVRELRNVALRALVLADGGPIDSPHLGLRPQIPLPLGLAPLLPPPRAVASRGELVAAIGRNGGNRTRAALELGISRSTLYARLKKLGLSE